MSLPNLVLSINRIGHGLVSSVAVWDIGSWCQLCGLSVGQHYEVTMSVHCHNVVSILMSDMTNNVART